MGSRALIAAGFFASLMVAGMLDLFAAAAEMAVADVAGAGEAAGRDGGDAALELMSMVGRPGIVAFVCLGLWIGLFVYTRKAVREEGRSAHLTAAQVLLLGAPALTVVLGVALAILGVFWALELEAS